METGRSRPSWNIANLDSPFRTVILVCAVAMLCYLGNSYVPEIPPNYIATFWPDTAFLVAVLLLVPRRIWPVLMAAGLGAIALVDLTEGMPIGSEIWEFLGDLAEVLVATFGISWLLKGEPHLSSVKTLAKYFAVAVILAPLVSALVGANAATSGGYWLRWRLMLFADALAFLTVTPAILSWVHEGRAWARKSRNYLELAALMISLVLFGYLTFMGIGRQERPALLYSLVPLLLWAALRLGLKGVSTSMVVVTLLSIWGATNGRGPFAEQGPLGNTLSLQLFLFFAAMPFTVLAVLVAEHKRAQQSLIDEEAQLAEAQRLAKVGSWQWDPDADRVTWSEELYRIAGLDPNLPAVSYKEHSKLYTAESWERLRHVVEEALRTGTPYELDLEMVRSDGTTRWLFARGEARRVATGRAVQLRGTVQDITQRKRTEDALRESEERLHLAVRAGRMYAFEWDTSTDVIVRTGECADIFNWMDNPERVTGQQFFDRIHPDDREAYAVLRADLTLENPTYKTSYRVLRPDGSLIWLEANGRAFFDGQGSMLRIIGMVTDVTERKLAEEALSSVSRRLIEAQEQERARIARELHDDLSQRMALLQIGLEQFEQETGGLSPQAHQQLDKIAEVITEISSGIHNLSHRLHPSKLDTLGLIASLGGLCREVSEQHRLRVQFVHHDVPGQIPQDVTLCLFRITQEALQNVVKHSGATEAQVELSGHGDGIDLCISDSGAGFSPEGATGELGLGLISMRERLRLVGGHLAIESEPSHGTRIHVRVSLFTTNAEVTNEGKTRKIGA